MDLRKFLDALPAVGGGLALLLFATHFPVFETAARFGVPLFIHPQIPQRAVRDVYYSGFNDQIDTAFGIRPGVALRSWYPIRPSDPRRRL
jgi:hypothetical protein